MMSERMQTTGRRLLVAAAVLLAGYTYGCVPSLQGLLTTFNPGGTILGSVTAEQIDTLFVDVPDYEYDPTCTIPGYGFNSTSTSSVNGGTCATAPVWPHTPGIRP